MNNKGIKLLYPYMRKYRVLFFLCGITSIIEALGTIATSMAVNYITDIALSSNVELLIKMGIVVIICIFFLGLITFINACCNGRVNNVIIRDLQNEISNHLTLLPISYIEKKHSGDIISRLNNDVNEVTSLINNILNTIYQPVVFIGAFTYFMVISPKLLITSIILIPLSAFIYNKITKPIQKRSKELMEQKAALNTVTKDTITGLEVVKAYQINEVMDKLYENRINRALSTSLKIQKLRSSLTPIFLALRFIPQLIIPLYGGYLAIQNEITIGELLAANIISWALFSPVEYLLDLLQRIRTGVPALDRLNEILQEKMENYDGKNLDMLNSTPIEFFHVNFKYGDNEVLNDLSFTIESGRRVALVGASGSGKSTILKLIYGFCEEQGGEVLIYGNATKDVKREQLRSKLSFVSQDSYLFPGTITDNILIGKMGATMDDVIEAAKKADCHEFIMKLPLGYDTLVGQAGIKLSGGERQRICLARAILKDAQILLFDEPTSSLDTQSEKAVLNALRKVWLNKTVLIVAHRLSTIIDVDEILVINEGKIVERGKHEELISNSVIYRKLYEISMDKEGGESVAKE